MTRSWKDVRRDVVAGALDEQRIERSTKAMREEVEAFKLSEVRKARQVSQTSLAEVMGVKQPRVSAIERGSLSRTELGTLESYVEALGGTVHVVAQFDDQAIILRD